LGIDGFETSRQAQFVVPMEVSLGFCILFTTLVCLLVLPCLYLVINKKPIPNEEDSQSDIQTLIKSKVL
jgi:hypothetical protein